MVAEQSVCVSIVTQVLLSEPSLTEYLLDLFSNIHSPQPHLFFHNRVGQEVKVFAVSKAKLLLLFQLVQPHNKIVSRLSVLFVSFGLDSGRYYTGVVPIE